MTAAGTRQRSTYDRARGEIRAGNRLELVQRATDLRTQIEQSSGLLTPGKRIDPATTNQILAKTAVLLDDLVEQLGGAR